MKAVCMKLFDQHLHSRHSFDSHAEPEDNVRRALELGLAGLSFTEHYDTHPDETPDCVFDENAYADTIAQLRDQHASKLFIGKGVEIDYQADNMDAIIAFIERNQFDIVLLSVHWSEGQPIHKQEIWRDRDPSDVTRRYLLSVLEAARHCERLHRDRPRVFDVLGHLDFCKRYSDRFAGSMHIEEHMDVIEDILTTCLAADIVPEVNTSTLRNDMPDPMPGPATIKRYAELGGTMMCVGSDAHIANDIGAGFNRALNMLRAADIEQLAVFQSRKRQGEPITE